MHLLHDRYAVTGNRACDLVSGNAVCTDDAGNSEGVDETGLERLIELFEHGRDGKPRWIVAMAHHHRDVAGMRRRAAAAARHHGYVAIGVDVHAKVEAALAEALRERALLLLGDAGTSSTARRALVAAAARSIRPHVLMTFETGDAMPSSGFRVREARAVFGGQVPAPATRLIVPSAEVRNLLARREQATALAAAGRHAAACRVLREVASALDRRHAYREAIDTLLSLVALLVERDRLAEADRVVRDAVGAAAAAEDECGTCESRWWEAYLKLQRRLFTEAESICRALAATAGDPTAATAANVLLASCLVEQGRVDEARVVPLPIEQAGQLRVWVRPVLYDVVVSIALAEGRMFDAGRVSREAVTWFAATQDAKQLLAARISQLRVICAAGDLVLAEAHWRETDALARRLHCPIAAAWARLRFLGLLTRLGESGRARVHARCLSRMARVASPLLAHAIHAASVAVPSRRPSDSGAKTRVLPDVVQCMYDEPDDLAAIRLAAEKLASELATSRLDVYSGDGGVPTSVVVVGTGVNAALGQRVLESGIAIGVGTGGTGAGVPVRRGAHLLGAIVARWPVDRVQPSETEPLMSLFAALIAPRLENLELQSRLSAAAVTEVPELIGGGAAMTELRKGIARAARAPFAVLIEGESGTGKELVARAIHHLGPRRQRRFCDVNCAALPDDLLESELFGHAKGAFTGAIVERAGLFEEATGGTLFLDEVADLSPRGQAKLLRVVQQQEVRRVGESISRIVDVRLVAAANRDLSAEAEIGRFRRDLVYRLNVIRIRIPPLRERLEDVPVLAHHFWRRAAERVGSHAMLSAEVVADLARYHWPGNVRELQNVIAALAVAAPVRGRVHRRLLPAAVSGAHAASVVRLAEARDVFERRFVETALAQSGGNRSRAARALGLTRQGLLKTMARLGLTGSATKSAG